MSIVTIYDVAKEAGYSIKTVSRVANGAPNVHPKTAAAISEVIRRLGYHPNPAARRLAGAASDTIGVVIDSITDPFFAQLATVIEQRARDHDMDVIIASSNSDVDRAQAQIQRFVRRGVRGLLYAPLGDRAFPHSVIPSDFPTVILDRNGGFDDRDLVNVTDRVGARDAVQHLVSHGHKRIAFLASTSYFSTVRERLGGYKEILEESNIPFDADLVNSECSTPEEAERGTRLMLSLADPPTAVFAAAPVVGHGVLRAQRHLDRQDLALVVFGNFPFAELMTPATTVIDQQPSAQAEAAMDLLYRRLGVPETNPVQILLPTELIRRGSGAIPPQGAIRS